MTRNEQLQKVLSSFSESYKELEILKKELIGKKVKIISNYNGQQFGSSKPKLTGKIFEIKSVFYNNSNVESPIGIFIEGHLLGLSLSEVEFIDD